MAESALSNFPHVYRAFVDFNKRAANAGSVSCRVRRAFVDLGIVLLKMILVHRDFKMTIDNYFFEAREILYMSFFEC